LQFPRFWKVESNKQVNNQQAPITNSSTGFQAFKIGEAANDDKQSSKVSVYIDQSFPGYQYVIRPPVDFATQFEYYTTIGKVQSSIDAYVSEVCTREYEWTTEDGEDNESGIEAVEEWAKKYNLKGLIEYMVRDLLVCGNNIIGITDWKPVQMDHLIGIKLKQDGSGDPDDYIFMFNGKWESLPLKPDQYIHNKFIDINRMPFGIGLFHALTTSFIWNGHAAVPQLELYRRHLQNTGVVEDKYAWQRVLYAFDGTTISQPELDKLREQLKAIKPGERWMTTRKPELITETIDAAKNGLLDITKGIMDEEVTAGLQSSVNRLRTQPSAMADAKESNTKDDAMLLYIFSKIEDIINEKILPLIPGAEGVEFQFGQQDDLELNFQSLLQLATTQIGNKPVISISEFRTILRQKGVPISEDDSELEEFQADLDQQKQDQMQQQFQMKNGGGDMSANDDDSKQQDDDDVEELRKEAYRKIIKKIDKE
jgi:hypothetical protein